MCIDLIIYGSIPVLQIFKWCKHTKSAVPESRMQFVGWMRWHSGMWPCFCVSLAWEQFLYTHFVVTVTCIIYKKYLHIWHWTISHISQSWDWLVPVVNICSFTTWCYSRTNSAYKLISLFFSLRWHSHYYLHNIGSVTHFCVCDLNTSTNYRVPVCVWSQQSVSSCIHAYSVLFVFICAVFMFPCLFSPFMSFPHFSCYMLSHNSHYHTLIT